MGGNIVLQYKGDEVTAERIDLTKYNRTEIVNLSLQMFADLNEQFRKASGEYLWTNFNLLKSGAGFTGSSEFFFQLDKIDDETFVKYKPTVGDIDVTVPSNVAGPFGEFLADIVGENINESTIFLGSNKYSSTGNGQYNTLFEMQTSNGPINIQVDFEFKEWEEDRPSEFGHFMNSSHWDDITKGIKGSIHKYILFSIVENADFYPDVWTVTEKGQIKSGKTAKRSAGTGAISTAGFRKKRVPLTNAGLAEANAELSELQLTVPSTVEEFREEMLSKKKNDPFDIQIVDGAITVDGTPALLELSSSRNIKDVDGNKLNLKVGYNTNLREILKEITKTDISSEDIQQFKSFHGCLQFMKDNFDEETNRRIFDSFIRRFWAPGAQATERNKPELDKNTKMIGANEFAKVFPWAEDVLKSDAVTTMIDKYYASYRLTEDVVIDGSSEDYNTAIQLLQDAINNSDDDDEKAEFQNTIDLIKKGK